MNRKFIFILFIVFLGGIFYGLINYYRLTKVNSYQGCLAAKGSYVLTTYPGVCITRIGARFTDSVSQMTLTSPLPTLLPSSSPLLQVDTTGWQTYTNKALSFSLKYPSSFYLTSGTQEPNLVNLKNDQGYYLTIKVAPISDYRSWLTNIRSKLSQQDLSAAHQYVSGREAFLESRQSSGSLFERNILIDEYYSLVHLNVAGDEKIINNVYDKVETLADQILSTFTLTPISFDTKDNSSLPSNTFDFCSSLQPKTKFSLQPPSGWTLLHEKNTNQYQVVSPDKSQSLTISCGNGYGGGCEQPGLKLRVAGKDISTCTTKDPASHFLLVNVAYFHDEPTSIIRSEYVNTFSLTGKIEEPYLDQILSSFRFLE